MKALFVAALFSFSALTTSVFANDLTTDAVGVTAVTDAQLMGRWMSTTPIYSGNGMTVSLGLEFKANTGVMSSICQYPGGKTLEAKIEVPVNAGGGAITVLSTGKNEVKDGNYTCNVEIQTGTVNYSFVGATLRMSAGGRSLDFARRN